MRQMRIFGFVKKATRRFVWLGVCVQFENAAISVPAVVQVIGANKSGVRFSGANKLSRRGSKNCPNIPKITVSDVTFLKRTDKVNKLVSISSFLEGSVSF